LPALTWWIPGVTADMPSSTRSLCVHLKDRHARLSMLRDSTRHPPARGLPAPDVRREHRVRHLPVVGAAEPRVQ
jgi:hypothetical protein